MDKASGYGLAGASSRVSDYQTGAAIPPKQPPMQEHSQRLHALAEELATLNGRLSNLLDRVVGPTPEANGDKVKGVPENPTGVLYVAEFGAQRIANEADRLRNLVSRLENIA